MRVVVSRELLVGVDCRSLAVVLQFVHVAGEALLSVHHWGVHFGRLQLSHVKLSLFAELSIVAPLFAVVASSVRIFRLLDQVLLNFRLLTIRLLVTLCTAPMTHWLVLVVVMHHVIRASSSHATSLSTSRSE